MKEKIEERIVELINQEQHLIKEIGQFERATVERKATLISVRGGIIERRLMLKELNDSDVSEQIKAIDEATEELHEEE